MRQRRRHAGTVVPEARSAAGTEVHDRRHRIAASVYGYTGTLRANSQRPTSSFSTSTNVSPTEHQGLAAIAIASLVIQRILHPRLWR